MLPPSKSDIIITQKADPNSATTMLSF